MSPAFSLESTCGSTFPSLSRLSAAERRHSSLSVGLIPVLIIHRKKSPKPSKLKAFFGSRIILIYPGLSGIGGGAPGRLSGGLHRFRSFAPFSPVSRGGLPRGTIRCPQGARGRLPGGPSVGGLPGGPSAAASARRGGGASSSFSRRLRVSSSASAISSQFVHPGHFQDSSAGDA